VFVLATGVSSKRAALATKVTLKCVVYKCDFCIHVLLSLLNKQFHLVSWQLFFRCCTSCCVLLFLLFSGLSGAGLGCMVESITEGARYQAAQRMMGETRETRIDMV